MHIATRRPLARAAVTAVLGLVLLTGCLTVDSTMKADGSGTMEFTYPPPAGATKASETKRFTSEAVSVESAEVSPDGKKSTLKLKFTDATKLSTVEPLKDVKVTRTKQDGTEKVSIVIKPVKVLQLKPGQLKDEPPLSIKVTMPGKITEANAKGTTEGATVTWKVPLADFVSAESTELALTYELPKS
jgi:hypothetical protein